MRRLAIPCLCLAAGLSAARADDPAEHPPRTITIRPAAEPVPALRYRLLPERRELVPGNAAVFYHRAIERMTEIRLRQSIQAHANKKSPAQINSDDRELQDNLSRPLASFSKEVVRPYLETHSVCLHEIELGARREFCDWELMRRDEGFTLQIGEIQEARGLGRLVVLKARLELAEGRIDSAIRWLQTGFALARHVGQGNIFIQSLVSAAMTTQLTDVLEELIQTPGAPNLYWALANRPRPFLELADAIEGERYALEKEIPDLKKLDSGPWSIDQARAFADELKQKYSMLINEWSAAASPTTRPAMKDLGEHMLFASIVARAYPTAKRDLIAAGRPAAQVEAMPAVQVVALQSFRQYQEVRDDIFKWAGLPYWQAYRGLEDAEGHPRHGWERLKAGIPFVLVLPAIRSVFVVPTRIDRRLDVVQAIEAIRLYAANHGGSLPPSLEAITEAPVPLDPATGKPFAYKLDGDVATLTAPPPPGWGNVPQFKVDYRLKPSR